MVDESIDQAIVDRLRKDGHQVLYVAEMFPSIDDDRVLEAANQQGAVLLTADQDFAEIVLRQGRLSKGEVAEYLEALFGPTSCASVTRMSDWHGASSRGMLKQAR